MPDSKRILSSIAVVARRLGRAPSLSEYVSLAGVPRYFVWRFYPKWNDAVRAAGFRPYRLKVQPEDGELLKDWGETVRRKRTLPSRRAYLV